MFSEAKGPGTGVVSIQPIDQNGQPSIDAIASKQPTPANSPEKKSDWWLYEMGALFLSAVTIVLMCVFLLSYDGLEAPSWSSSSDNGRFLEGTPQTVKAQRVNFSSILALFGTLTQALLAIPLAKGLGLLTWIYFTGKNDRKLADFTVFDSAAKKSNKGAAKLLWMLKGKHFAVIGALLVLGLQGLSFFIQQLVSLPVNYWPDKPQQIASNDPTWIQLNKTIQAINNGSNESFPSLPTHLQLARIANATAYTPTNIGAGPYYGLELQMKANIWAGLFDTDNLNGWSIPSYYCSTGNCTWTNYSSLGVCSRCADITTKLNKTCTSHVADLKNATGCDINLPNGFALGGLQGARNNLLAASTDFSPLVYGNYTSPLAIIQSIWANDSTLFVNDSTPIIASECVLVPCVIKYASAVVSSSQDLARLGLNIIPYSESADSIIDDYTFNSANSSTSTGPTLNVAKNGNEPTTYHMSEDAYTGLTYYLQSMFNGFVSANGNVTSYLGDNKTRPLQADVQDTMQSLYSPDFSCYDVYGNLVYNMVACSIINVAIAMTTVIRNDAFNSYDFSHYSAIGTTYHPNTTVDVTWLWIIPIGVLWLLCAILAFGTIMKARRAGVGGMSLSPLTLLFLDVENKEAEGPHRPAWFDSEEEAQKMAQQMQVRLKMSDGKVSFVQGLEKKEG